ncbi:MAG TPA: PEP-CTERM sorting domain-containing protein, partial [Tepidisphaeraceae bacterium]|nr:PEP-CTERM sorting domain-containing protein [Tepidisphaeraceae bacterium]
GVVRTTQALDYATGAGRVDLSKAFDQFLGNGTHDLTGLGGGSVETVGWDYGRAALGSPSDYLIDRSLLGGSELTATLDWFADSRVDDAGFNPTYGSLDELDLQVWSAIDGIASTLVAESDSAYGSSQHLSFALPSDGDYLLRVVWAQTDYNLAGDAPAADYAIAWSSTAVPEPASMTMLGIAAVSMTRLRRRRRVR